MGIKIETKTQVFTQKQRYSPDSPDSQNGRQQQKCRLYVKDALDKVLEELPDVDCKTLSFACQITLPSENAMRIEEVFDEDHRLEDLNEEGELIAAVHEEEDNDSEYEDAEELN